MGWFNRGGVVEHVHIFADGMEVEVHPATTYDIHRIGQRIDNLQGIVLEALKDYLRPSLNRIARLEATVAQLECGVKGHLHRRTCEGDAARLQEDDGTYIDCDDLAGHTGKLLEHGTRITVKCLDCGATISDDWKAKEIEDDSDK